MLPSTLPEQSRLPPPDRAEAQVVTSLMAALPGHLKWQSAVAMATPWVQAVREKPAPFWALESLLREYPISSAEGLALMRLAEALLRVPDAETALALTADQLGRARFEGPAQGSASLSASLSSSAIALSKKLLPDEQGQAGLFKRLGAKTVLAATSRAIQLLGQQFVLGRDIDEATAKAQRARTDAPALRFSYDMLGEGARTDADAQRYLDSYRQAIQAIAAGRAATDPAQADGISIKLSALFARYEVLQRKRVFSELLPRVRSLVAVAAHANLNLTIDAEESDRLELSLDVLEALAAYVAATHPAWRGLGLAVQAYQTRALEVIDEIAAIARRHKLRFMVRLVKGAYWDSEIKRAQELGLGGYPVFTRKAHTDISYLACAQALIGRSELIFPQFATHNAGTIAAILQMVCASPCAFEMQRLHGMGVGIYREVDRLAHPPPVRVYAPVGEHRDLLAYLVRRLLENGANSSFVHQLADDSLSADSLLASPLNGAGPPGIPLPVDLYGPSRKNSRGVDLADLSARTVLLNALRSAKPASIADAHAEGVASTMARLQAGHRRWNATALEERCAALRRAGDALEAKLSEFCALLVHEGGKTFGDAIAEVREAVDFCRYYAEQAETKLAPQLLPGPTGESNELRLHGRGVFVCISPWNFPLAIFTGQVVAALVAGNAVAAKPAEQTPAVALRMVELLHAAGVPHDALALVCGPGDTIGAALVGDPHTAGVCFTGSTVVAQTINRTLAARSGAIATLIAETGGLNAMVVDSSALPEQVVDAVVQSAFRSAGQRCSALRLLCVHESIADTVIAMMAGALAELTVGDPAELSTDVGPVIDNAAFAQLARSVERLHREAKFIAGAAHVDAKVPRLIAPIAFEIAHIADLREEIFGPVLHVVRWRGDVMRTVDEINALGYGLTLGIQTRIDSRALNIAKAARVGNVYVNRNMVGAVVGVQPFGGEGLSGTGPKAGGPHYLYRFCSEQALTINTAAAGGNVQLLSARP